MRRPRFWRGGPDCARGSEDVVLLEARRALLDREGAAVVECKRLDHRESLLGQPPISEQRSEHGLGHAQGRSWVKVIELARQPLPWSSPPPDWMPTRSACAEARARPRTCP